MQDVANVAVSVKSLSYTAIEGEIGGECYYFFRPVVLVFAIIPATVFWPLSYEIILVIS